MTEPFTVNRKFLESGSELRTASESPKKKTHKCVINALGRTCAGLSVRAEARTETRPHAGMAEPFTVNRKFLESGSELRTASESPKKKTHKCVINALGRTCAGLSVRAEARTETRPHAGMAEPFTVNRKFLESGSELRTASESPKKKTHKCVINALGRT